MRTSTLTVCCLVAPLMGFSSPPALAQDHKPRLTFRDIEFDTPRGQREAVGRAMLAEAIPPGLPVRTARDVLRDRGAHCRAISADGVLHCIFGAFDTIDNHLQDVTWDIRVASGEGIVKSLTIHRDSRGS